MRSLGFFLNQKIDYNDYNVYIYIPPIWNFLILKSNNDFNKIYHFFLYSECYYFYITLFKNFNYFIFNKSSNVLLLKFIHKNNYFNLYWFNFLQILYSFSSFFFKKLKVRGKGYYFYKNFRNTITFKFGYSHRIYLYSYFIMVKFLSKTSVFMFGINKFDILNQSRKFFNVRPFNLFTGKGVRFTRQIIYKKIGKVSSFR
jgi:hypothetical protein